MPISINNKHGYEVETVRDKPALEMLSSLRKPLPYLIPENHRQHTGIERARA